MASTSARTSTSNTNPNPNINTSDNTAATTTPTTTTTATDPDVQRVLSFWFDGDKSRWFEGGPSFDGACRTFEPLVRRARASDLRTWEASPDSALALILLLDQFPRNLYRQSGDAHASDAQACALAARFIAAGFDRQVSPLQACFFYLPLEHDEALVSQIASVALCEILVGRCVEGSEDRKFLEAGLAYARRHLDAIARFGRFPARNTALGRESTADEIEFLKEHPEGF